ncbi:ABC transporter ATP-binding protein [Hippea maritima]|uniref:ABC transporter related protein n=1 Tax=Hippea maritima (strain ATCC 700847 / DSM 10411 / MH2) TaxID=760142 RepID=F2LW39_HIPMA|nr:ABC transporter ATP-binding protein [Hippea maritima]AEA33973.1 ABC transporter related protein [Hippea maritima DSM 10411]
MMLKVDNVCVSYGKAKALKGVSIEVRQGEAVAVIGSNGSGKTTLLNAIVNVVNKSGRVSFLDKDITNTKTYKIMRMGMAYLPDRRTVFADLSVYDNLIIAAFSKIKSGVQGYFKNESKEIFEMFPNLKDKLYLKAGLLSGGEQQMLSLAQLLLRKPRFIMLDEPSAGLSPKLVKQLFDIIVFMKESGFTVLVVEQNVNKTVKVADRVYVLKNGVITDTGNSEDFQDELRIKRAYFGG